MIKFLKKVIHSVAIIIVDSVPDWNTASLWNAIFFMRLWKECNLDILCVCSYAARYSAYNPIEHLWSPISKHLNSVRFTENAEGDEKPLCSIPNITSEELQTKQFEVFNNAISELCNAYWKSSF